MQLDLNRLFPYRFNQVFTKPVAYFSMEFAIDQALKTYSGGLGFLAGSHMKSAYELRQNIIGVGILWKYGYYDQERNRDGSLKVNYTQKDYYFLEETGIHFIIEIHRHPVHVKVLLLRPEIFKTAPVFFLSTDVPENDFLAQTISHRLYDNHESARIAQSILLGVGGAKLLDVMARNTEIYHLNEGHALPLCFYLLNKFKGNLEEVRKHVVFTTHTPEPAGNEEHDVSTLDVLGFFQGAEQKTIYELSADHKTFNYTLAALRMSKRANGVSKIHGKVSREMWKDFSGICNIGAITNAQNKTFWMDQKIQEAFEKSDYGALLKRKKELKRKLFKVIANQTGRIFSEDVLTIVWARRFASYKRADLILSNENLFRELVMNQEKPVQIIWAGKPYPEDSTSIEKFNKIFYFIKEFSNCAALTGYEIELSGLLKKGSDLWLNNPQMYREASGTSGMTAAMNASVNFSIPDGWIPEYAEHGKNCFLITPAADHLTREEKDDAECQQLHETLRSEILPRYYSKKDEWSSIMMQGIRDVLPAFDSNRMATEYYQALYLAE